VAGDRGGTPPQVESGGRWQITEQQVELTERPAPKRPVYAVGELVQV
jgi:hypothetical protein